MSSFTIYNDNLNLQDIQYCKLKFDMYKKRDSWNSVIFPYCTVAIWGVDPVLPDYAANW